MMLSRHFIVIFLVGLLCSCFPEKPSKQWQLAFQGAYSAAISQTGDGILVGSFQHGGSYWTTQPVGREYNWNHREGFLTEILFSDISADGRLAMTANYYNLVLWNTQTGEPIWFWSAPARIESADLSADGRFALLGLDNSTAVLFDIQNGGVLREFQHGGPVIATSLNVSASLALTGSEDGTAKLWNLRNAELIRSFDFQNQVSVVKLSDSGRLAFIVPANEQAELWDLQGRQKVADIKTAKFRLYSARFVNDDSLITGTTHRNVFEFDTKTGEKTRTWQIGTESKNSFKSAIVLDVAVRPGELLALGSNGYLYAFER